MFQWVKLDSQPTKVCLPFLWLHLLILDKTNATMQHFSLLQSSSQNKGNAILVEFLCECCCIHVSNMTQTKGHFTGFSTFYNFSLPETKQKAILQSLLPFTATVFNTRQKKSLFYNLIPSFSLSLQCETKQKATLQPLQPLTATVFNMRQTKPVLQPYPIFIIKSSI